MKSPKYTKSKSSAVGKGLHPRNQHRERYDFSALIKSCPALAAAVSPNAYGDLSIDFANPLSVKQLNQALLRHFYQVKFWDIPEGYLCPPIPGRADYVHYLADLLRDTESNPRLDEIPRGKKIAALDIGMGANCIYPILGSRLFGWGFVGSDVDPVSVDTANMMVSANLTLKGQVRCRLQQSAKHIFKGVIQADELFDITLCNPPFHRSLAEASAGAKRKVANLAFNKAKKSGQKKLKTRDQQSVKSVALNFGGQKAELWCPGGEAAFIEQMIIESADFSQQCLWFSSLVSKKETLAAIYKRLKSVNAIEVKTIEMQQGNKVTRIVAWTFLDKEAQAQWCDARWAG